MRVATMMRAAIVSIAAAVDNVEADRCSRAELDELAGVCECLAAALRSGDRPEEIEIEAEVVSVVIEQ